MFQAIKAIVLTVLSMRCVIPTMRLTLGTFCFLKMKLHGFCNHIKTFFDCLTLRDNIKLRTFYPKTAAFHVRMQDNAILFTMDGYCVFPALCTVNTKLRS